jgi:hypothetical protein
MRALLLTVLLPAAAFAQASAVKDKEEIKFNEIERGFTVGAAGGFWMFFNSPGPAPSSTYPNPRPLTMGQTARIDLGFDIGERVVAGLMLQAANNRAGSDYLGTTVGSGTAASGDFSELMPGAAVKVNIIGFEDNQNVKRTWLYARLAGAACFYFPSTLINKFDVNLQGSVGVEYFTKLRHFAIGLEVSALFNVLTGTFGLTATPTLRYSF